MRSLLILLLLASVAQAAPGDDVGLGMYAPTAAFDGPVARLDFVSALAAHVAQKTGKATTGRAYAKASDFAAAVRRGEIQFAVVDAAYVAALGVPYTVLAEAGHGGSTQVAWEIVTSDPAKTVMELKGKTVVVPAIGARDDAFFSQVLLGGELAKDHFGKVITAPDALSALAAVEHGRAEVAIVPAGLARPANLHRVASLGGIGLPVLVALPGAVGADEVANAVTSFSGGAVIDHFTRGGADATRELAGRFARAERRPPMAIPQLHLAASALLAGRKFQIARPELAPYILSGN